VDDRDLRASALSLLDLGLLGLTARHSWKVFVFSVEVWVFLGGLSKKMIDCVSCRVEMKE
jgi:hypothetical protein